MHKPTTRRKSRIPRMKGNSQRFYHYTHTFSVSYNAYNFGMEGSIKKLVESALKLLYNAVLISIMIKMRQVVGLCIRSITSFFPMYRWLLRVLVQI